MLRTGCLPHDPARAQAMPVARFGAVLAPAFVGRPSWQPRMWGNNIRPNCTGCALGNNARAFSARVGGTDVEIATPAIDRIYARGIGRPDATLDELAATEGADPLAVIAAAQVGGWDIGGQTLESEDYRLVPLDRPALAATTGRLGSCMAAVTLYAADMDAAIRGRPMTGDPRGAVVARHMICICGYAGLTSDDAVDAATWGAWMPLAWSWLEARLQLAVAAAWPQFMPPGPRAAYNALWGETG